MSGVPNSDRTTVSSSSGPSTTSTQSTQDNAQARTTLAVGSFHSNNPLSDTDDDLSDAPENPVFPDFSTSSYLGSTAPPSDSDSELSDVPDSPVWPEYPRASPTRSPSTQREKWPQTVQDRTSQTQALDGTVLRRRTSFFPSDMPTDRSSFRVASNKDQTPGSPRNNVVVSTDHRSPWELDRRGGSHQARCTEGDCPVKKAVRYHKQGPYLHHGKHPRTNETLFSDSNPPPHVWESWMKIQARDPSSTVEDDWNVLGFLRYHVENPNTCFMGI